MLSRLSACPRLAVSGSNLGGRSRFRLGWLAAMGLSFAAVPAFSQGASAQEIDDAATLLPPSTVLYFEVGDPDVLVQTLVEHPLRARIESMDEVKKAKRQAPYLAFVGGVSGLEAQLEMGWQEIISGVAGEGIVIAFDPETQGLAIGLQGDGSNTQERLLESLVKLTRFEASSNNRPDPVRTSEYRDVPVMRIGEGRIARYGDWVWIVTNDEMGKELLDAAIDGRSDSLAAHSVFAQARETAGEHSAWGFLDVEQLRNHPDAKEIPDKTDNPGAEVLIGGLLDLARHVPHATMTFDMTTDRIAASVTTPLDQAWMSESREYWWGIEGTGQAPARLNVPNALVQIEYHRDLSEMWLRAGDLFVDRTVDQFDQAESTLSTLFGGADFGSDILGAFGPSGHLIVAHQSFEDPTVAPDIKLPGFALVVEMEDAAQMVPQLRRNFQSLIGFINITGAMNGQPQLDQETERGDGWQLLTAYYVAPIDDDRETAGLPIQYNFSPSIGFAGDRCVISSTIPLAKTLLKAEPANSESTSETLVDNTAALVVAKTLQTVLADNQQQLIAQTMLEDGKSREEATRDIGLLTELVGWFGNMTMQFEHDSDHASLEMELRFEGSDSRSDSH